MTLTTTSTVLDSVLAGERTLADAIAAGDFELTSSTDAIERMFTAIGFPAHLLSLDQRLTGPMFRALSGPLRVSSRACASQLANRASTSWRLGA